MKSVRNNRNKAEAFTLIEVLLAVGIFAIVLFAINTVFFSALRLERATTRAVDARLPLNQAFAILRRDLAGAVQPNTNSYLLTRDFRASATSGGFGADGSGSIDFYTTTGQINDNVPWGDLQRVRYELVAPLEPNGSRGMDLVRVITRNVLATTEVDEEEQFLMGEVESLGFRCYDGTDWRDTWDTTAADVGLPQAVQVRVQLVNTNSPNQNFTGDPFEIIVPVVTQSLTNQPGTGS